MSDQSQGPGWWLASDGRWYPPESAPAAPPVAPAEPAWSPTGEPAGPWGSSTAPPAWGAPPPGYGYGYGAAGPAWGPPPLPSVNGMATASLVCGILGAVPCLGVNGLLAIVALVLGVIVVRRINAGTAAPDGRGMAIAGIVLGTVGTVLLLLWVTALVLGANESALAATIGTWS